MELGFLNRILANLSVKKLVWRLCLLVILLLVGRFLVHFVTSATITVTTGSKTASVIVATAPISTTRSNIVKQGKSKLNARIRSGDYIISVQDGSSSTSRLIHLGWLSSKRVGVSLPKAVSAEPVLYDSVTNVIADNNRMTYLSNDFSKVEYVDSNNKQSVIEAGRNFTSVAWADTHFGIAQDSSGKLYVIDNGTARPLTSPISGFNDVSGTVFTVTPNRTIYIGLGSYVYRGTANGKFARIYGNSSPTSFLVAANDKVMVLNPGVHTVSGKATVIYTNGKLLTKRFGYSVNGWTQWSSDGKYIVISTGAKSALFDASLNQVASIPQATTVGDNIPQTTVVSNGSWLGDTLFYSFGGQLWSYNVSQQEVKLAATMPRQEIIQSVSVSTDSAYVYVTTSTSDNPNPSMVRRVGLRGQTTSTVADQLQDILPLTNSGAIIGLRNFASPLIITVNAIPGTDPSEALQTAKTILQGVINVNTTEFDTEVGD